MTETGSNDHFNVQCILKPFSKIIDELEKHDLTIAHYRADLNRKTLTASEIHVRFFRLSYKEFTGELFLRCNAWNRSFTLMFRWGNHTISKTGKDFEVEMENAIQNGFNELIRSVKNDIPAVRSQGGGS